MDNVKCFYIALVIVYMIPMYVAMYLFCSNDLYLQVFFFIRQGIEAMLPFISKRKVIIAQKDVVILLTRDRPFCNEFSTGTQEQLNKIEGLIL